MDDRFSVNSDGEEVFNVISSDYSSSPRKNRRRKPKRAPLRKYVEKLIYRRKKRGSYFNINFLNFPINKQYVDFFHFILDLTWWKLFLLFAVSYLFLHATFGGLYFLGKFIGVPAISSISESNLMVYMYCFFFSVDVIQTTGSLGVIVPTGPYERTIITLESFVSYFFCNIWIAWLMYKFMRPSLLKKNFLFSKNCVIFKDKDRENQYVINIRLANLRAKKSPPCDVLLDLLLVLWEDQDETFKVYHLDYFVYEQTPLSKITEFAAPILPLPHEINHIINRNSPFFPYLDDVLQYNEVKFEFVVVIESIDSATAHNYQKFYNFTQAETILNERFVPMTKSCKKTGKYIVDFRLMNETEIVPIWDGDETESDEEEEEGEESWIDG